MMTDEQNPDGEPWHFDRRIPIATILVLVTQLVLGVVWITTLSNRVDSMDQNYARRITAMELQQARTNDQAQEAAVQIGRQAEILIGMRADLNRLIIAVERSRGGDR